MTPAATRMVWILGLAGGAAVLVGGVALASKKSSTSSGGAAPLPSATAAPGIASLTLSPGLNTQVILSLSRGGILNVYPPASMGPNPTGATSAIAVSSTPSVMSGQNIGAGGGVVQSYKALADGATTLTFGWTDLNGASQSATVLVSVVT
jgi:hypothetical protein